MNVKSEYKVIGRIGEGAHGIVLKAKNRKTGKLVALKRMLNNKGNEKVQLSLLREIESLKHVNSTYVIKLLEVLTVGSSVVLVLELMAGGLSSVIGDVDDPIQIPQVKAYSRMILEGCSHLHKLKIMHRDLKPANLLIGFDGILKIADLGQARLNKGRPYSHQIGSRWYRAPELLYGSRKYSLSIDVWSIGCIIAEMINCSPLFAGESDIEQLAIVIKSLGSPSEETWPGVHTLPDYGKITFPKSKGKLWKTLIPNSPPGAIDLLKSLLLYNPKERLSCEQALNHSFFYLDPIGLKDNQMTLPSVFTRTKKTDDITYLLEEERPFNLLLKELTSLFTF
ncbi:mitogen-activated protein kinase ERK-A, putative [Pediculus humanus corporis]|uniref:Cyclin-dependent kinase 20 n=1 Tax=Pediculus humanus subsp. corporis TaxID=121224 RepID=E0VMM0_PEDHC|nr:mitogen-activated protein kinase ERK-A, putative [Pediculus humanus corporis]EEB14626.1 mitogen-activated protein kinase ERK-A, putative [Pediculus humanus corporis]